MVEINDLEFKLFQEYLSSSCGIYIPEEKRYLFNTRLDKILEQMKLESFSMLYGALLQDNSGELKNKIVEEMTTNETAFFRDSHPFAALELKVLPEIAAWKKKNSSSLLPLRLRIWSAACSTGQEPYSIAMIVREWMKRDNSFSAENIYIMATDISESVLKKARQGFYDDKDVEKGMREEYKGKYIVKSGTGWEITKEIKQMIEFRSLNLSKDLTADILPFDIIFCRNAIIYFSNDLKEKIINSFYRLLNPGGVFFIGAAENLYGTGCRFEALHSGPTTIYKAVTQ